MLRKHCRRAWKQSSYHQSNVYELELAFYESLILDDDVQRRNTSQCVRGPRSSFLIILLLG